MPPEWEKKITSLLAIECDKKKRKKRKKNALILTLWRKKNDIACDCRKGKLEWYCVPKTKNKKKENSMFYIYIYNGKKFRIS